MCGCITFRSVTCFMGGVVGRCGLPRHVSTAFRHRDYLEEEESSWIIWFCNLKGNEFFAEVDASFIEDDFNLVGLSSQVPYYEYALDTILDIQTPAVLTEEQQQMVDSAAELLYGLIHQRFILTNRGLNRMAEKFEDVDFGRCHRVLCEGQPVIPMGQADAPRKYTVSVFCPRCNDIYFPKSSRHSSVDGAFFGTSFPHLFFMTFPVLRPPPPKTPSRFMAYFSEHGPSPSDRAFVSEFISAMGTTGDAHIHSYIHWANTPLPAGKSLRCTGPPCPCSTHPFLLQQRPLASRFSCPNALPS